MVAGFGNTLLQDEGLGVHLIRELQRKSYPAPVEFRQAGTASLELIPHLAEVDHLIILDALLSGAQPAQVSIFGADDLRTNPAPSISVHQLGLSQTLALASRLGYHPTVTIFGVEPQNMRDCSLQLSPTLQKAWPMIIAQADQLIREIAASYA